ncbi:MAG: chemotaxis protein CheD [Chitinispirillaceae bacterium]
MVIQAVVGNCVAVCLWDRELRVGAMNHFLYPYVDKKQDATAVYGNVAQLAALRMMKDAGCRKESIVAHVLGGASPAWDKDQDLGERNSESARKNLERLGVEVVSEDVGGSVGRKIMFDISTGHVAILKVHDLRKTDWIEEQK